MKKQKTITNSEYEARKEIRFQKALLIIGLTIGMQIVANIFMLLVNLLK